VGHCVGASCLGSACDNFLYGFKGGLRPPSPVGGCGRCDVSTRKCQGLRREAYQAWANTEASTCSQEGLVTWGGRASPSPSRLRPGHGGPPPGPHSRQARTGNPPQRPHELATRERSAVTSTRATRPSRTEPAKCQAQATGWPPHTRRWMVRAGQNLSRALRVLRMAYGPT
jgi:hypothetical protein